MHPEPATPTPLSQLAEAVDHSLRRLAGWAVSGKRWKAKALLLVLAFCLFRAFPNYHFLQEPGVAASWRNAAIKSAQPQADMARLFPRDSHEAKLTFRLTVPLLARLLPLPTTGLLLLFAACGVLSLYQILLVAFRVTGSRASALWLCLAAGCTWPGALPFHQLLGGFYDAVALCLLLAAMSVEIPIVAGLCIFAAAWTDERALLAAALVFLFELARANRRAKALAIVLGTVAYAATRLYFAAQYSLHTAWEGTGLSVFLAHVNVAPLGLWSGLGGGWLLVVAALAILLWRGHRALASALLLTLAAITAAALCVDDTTRSMAYALPALLLAATVVAKSEGARATERLARIAALVCILTPTLFVQSGSLTWLLPFPVQLIRWLLYPRLG